MKNIVLPLLILLLVAASATQAQDGPFVQVELQTVYFCDAAPEAGDIPDLRGPACVPVEGRFISPYKRQIWLKGSLSATPALTQSRIPLGFFISAKASSTVWLNGSKLGSNGLPARMREGEIPGKMDAVFPLPQNALKVGKNEVVIELSGHHSLIPLLAPVHLLAVARYQSPTDSILRG